MKQRWVYTVRGRWGEFEGKVLLFQVRWSRNVSGRVMLHGRAAENERVNHIAHLEKHVPGGESKSQNTGQVQDFKTWSG